MAAGGNNDRWVSSLASHQVLQLVTTHPTGQLQFPTAYDIIFSLPTSAASIETIMIFAVISVNPENHDALVREIEAKFPADYFQASPDARVFFVSTSGTAKDISDRLGVGQPGGLHSLIVLAVSGYYGIAPMNKWEWIAAKIASPYAPPMAMQI
jgi:hypothetical protein